MVNDEHLENVRDHLKAVRTRTHKTHALTPTLKRMHALANMQLKHVQKNKNQLKAYHLGGTAMLRLFFTR